MRTFRWYLVQGFPEEQNQQGYNTGKDCEELAYMIIKLRHPGSGAVGKLETQENQQCDPSVSVRLMYKRGLCFSLHLKRPMSSDPKQLNACLQHQDRLPLTSWSTSICTFFRPSTDGWGYPHQGRQSALFILHSSCNLIQKHPHTNTHTEKLLILYLDAGTLLNLIQIEHHTD